MTKSEGIKIVSEWEAERELLNRGYTKAPCPQCKGAGHFLDAVNRDELLDVSKRHHWGRSCDHCEGQGWRWAAPIVREHQLCSMPSS